MTPASIDIEALRKQAAEAQNAIAEHQHAEWRKANAPKVGKCFRTKNSCSCPEKPSDYWWVYARVTRMDESGMLYAMTFQTDKYGNVNIEQDSCVHHAQYYTPCSAADLKKAWKKLLSKLNDYARL